MDIPALQAVSRLDAKHSEPLGAQSQRDAGLGSMLPWREGDRFISPARRGVWRHREAAGGVGRSDAELEEWHGGPVFEMQQRGASAAPLPEFVAEQCRPAAQYERAMRRKLVTSP